MRSSNAIPKVREGVAAVTPTPRRALPPYPSGWYAIAFADELRRGQTLTRSFAGREVVLYRTASGRAGAMDAYCPHMGAHLGFGGRVEGERLRCPFHGFCFDVDGRCVETGYGSKPPPNAVSRRWPLREVNSMLLLYLGAEGGEPAWEVPPVEARGWSRPVYRRFVLAAHPQETTENSVDLGHFSWVHGYRSVRMLRDPLTAGPYLSTAFAAQRPMLGEWFDSLRFHFEFETHIHGLGYSLVEVRVRGFDLRARLWVLPTPIDGDRIALCLAASGDGSGEVHPALRPLPRALRARLIGRFLLLFLAADARQDFVIWQNKRYVHPPALAHGDGPIGKYRTWAAQFYQDAASDIVPRAEPGPHVPQVSR